MITPADEPTTYDLPTTVELDDGAEWAELWQPVEAPPHYFFDEARGFVAFIDPT